MMTQDLCLMSSELVREIRYEGIGGILIEYPDRAKNGSTLAISSRGRKSKANEAV